MNRFIEKPKFSIIIPAYNAENFIEATLTSIFEQTYTNYEILVVDDCSTDNTYNLLKKYNNIKLLQTPENLRQGGARNLGLEHCSGEYIIFIDSDDTLYDSSVFEKLNNCIESNNNPDIIYTGMKISGKRDMILLPNEDNCKKEYRLAESKWTSAVSVCWKNELIQKNNIRFPEKLRYEDVYFNFLGIEKSKTYAYVDFIFYHYYNRDSSTTTTYSFEQAIDTIKIIEHLCTLKNFVEKENLPLLKKRIEQQCARVPVRLERAIEKFSNI